MWSSLGKRATTLPASEVDVQWVHLPSKKKSRGRRRKRRSNSSGNSDEENSEFTSEGSGDEDANNNGNGSFSDETGAGMLSDGEGGWKPARAKRRAGKSKASQNLDHDSDDSETCMHSSIMSLFLVIFGQFG